MKKILEKIKAILYSNTKLYFFVMFYYLLNKFRKSILKGSSFVKITTDSENIYEEYSNSEQEEYEKGSKICLYKNKLVKMSHKAIRHEYLKYVYAEIDELLKTNEKVKVVEVGCGNCLNIINILAKYPSVTVSGLDISKQRIAIAKSYYPQELKDVFFEVCDIAEGATKIEENSADLVFSMHCLEQISHDTKPALIEMYKLTKNKLVLIELVFELGVPAQKMYLTWSDHNRILLKTINKLGFIIKKMDKLIIQENPLNQSTRIVIEKGLQN